MNFRIATFVFSALFFSAQIHGQDNSAAWKRWQHLQRGVSVSGWFSESGNYSMQQLRAFTTPADIQRIREMGFDHVRIPVDPSIFQCETDWNSCERIQFLDQVIKKAIASDLNVILDLHAPSQYTHQLITNGQAAEKFLRLWATLADHYGKMDPDRIQLEVMNEFSSPDVNSWFGLLQQSIETIRRNAPTSTIIVQGAGYSDIWDLVRLPSLADTNLIYSFHYYEPHIFTHQGASWGVDYWLDIHGLSFPLTDNNFSELMDHADSPEVRWQLLQYKEDRWDASRIAGDIAFAAQWARARNIPLICDEFGVYRNFALPDDRERWLTAVRSAFDQNHIGWTMWDYQGGFGAVYKGPDGIRDDTIVLRALGLKRSGSD